MFTIDHALWEDGTGLDRRDALSTIDLAALGASADTLPDNEVRARRRLYGPDDVPSTRRRGAVLAVARAPARGSLVRGWLMRRFGIG